MELSERDDPQTEQGEAEHTPSQQQTLLTHQTAQGWIFQSCGDRCPIPSFIQNISSDTIQQITHT